MWVQYAQFFIVLHTFMQNFAYFLKNWIVLYIKFFYYPHLFNAVIDNVLAVWILLIYSVYKIWKASPKVSQKYFLKLSYNVRIRLLFYDF